MRREEAQTEQPHSYTTARTLLSILRLSQALARLRLDDIITRVHKCIQCRAHMVIRGMQHLPKLPLALFLFLLRPCSDHASASSHGHSTSIDLS